MSETGYSIWGSGRQKGDGGQLGVACAAGREIAAHERHALDLEGPERAGGGGLERLGQRVVATRLAHAAERDVRRELAAFRGKAEGDERSIDALGQARERRRSRRSRPQHTRPARVRKRAEPADLDLERGNRRDVRQRRDDVGETRLLHAAEELDGDVKVLGGDPGDAGSVRAERVDFPGQAPSDLVGQQNGDERPDRG